MKRDILCDLGTEKIRKDFGDFTASFFQILSFEGNCSMCELNLLFPTASYFLVRSTLFLLYQHNLISVKISHFKGLYCENFLENTRFFTNIYQAICRIRYPRFIAFSEYEFGAGGRFLIERILTKGQASSKKLVEFSKKKKNFSVEEIEDILIQLARDGLIYTSFFFLEVPKNFKGLYKPLRRNGYTPWKISIWKINQGMKINILINLLQDFSISAIKPLLITNFSRIFGFKSTKIDSQWFSIDTMVDFFFDITQGGEICNENQLIQVIEHETSEKNFVEIKQFFYKIRYQKLINKFRQVSMENLIRIKFGQKFFRIFRLLLNMGSASEESLADESWLNELEVRKILFEMFRIGLVFLEENSLAKKSFYENSKFLWKLNFQGLEKNLFSELIKSIFHILLKIEKLESSLKKINKKQLGLREGGYPPPSSFLVSDLYDVLLLGLTRLDEILLFFW